MEQYVITIVSINNSGKQSKTRIECLDIDAVARVLLTFSPKKGYDPVDFRITKEMVFEL